MSEWLVYLRGGPLNGKVYPSLTLLGRATQLPHVSDYKWTEERITHPETGETAQVWEYKVS